MKYQHVCRYVAETLWAIHPAKMSEIIAALAFKAAGGEFTPAEIQARIGEDRQPGGPSKRGAVAVLPVRGTIAHRAGGMDESSGGTSTERLSSMLRQLVADESIGTILLDVDSPGGTVPGVQEFADEVFAARESKHIVAVCNSMAASAAYWIASQAHEVICIPSGLAGSIGVFTVHQDLSKALEAEGIDVTVISAGKYKTEGSPFEPLSDEAREFIQSRVDEAYGQFVKAVARGRGVSVSDVRGGFGQGRTLPAKDAKAAGLIDRIGTMDETIGRLVGRKSTSGLRAEELTPEQIAAAEAVDEAVGTPFEATISGTFEADRLRRLERF